MIYIMFCLSGLVITALSFQVYRLKRRQINSHKLLELSLGGSKIGLWDWSLKRKTVHRSAGYGELLGYTKKLGDELIFHTDLIHPEDAPRLKAALVDYLQGRTCEYDVDYRLKTDSGEWRWVSDRGIIVAHDYKNRPTRIAGVTIDITKRKETEKKLATLSYTDPLTGLYNRAYFDQQLQLLNNAKALPLSVVIGDVNGLKLANDTFGHQAGDRLLLNISDLLRESFRRDDIITRWGGDEFAILLPNTSEEQALEICERIKGICAKAAADPIKPSIALGVATRRELDQPIEDILQLAEEWMYQHKLVEAKRASSALITSLVEKLGDECPGNKKLVALLGELIQAK